MTTPFYYLENIPFSLVEWRSLVNDFNKQQSIIDKGANRISETTRNFFTIRGILPSFGILWSWPKNQNPSMTYHTDADIDKNGTVFVTDYCSINFLLDGDGGTTEFISIDKVKEIGKIYNNDKVKLRYRMFENVESEYKAYLTPVNPIMMRTDVPHRVNTNDITKTRWTYSLRFSIKKNDKLEKARIENLISSLRDNICYK